MKAKPRTPRPRHASVIQGHLLRAFDEYPNGLTLDELRRLSGIKCSVESLSRKLKGTQALRSQESESLAKALRVDVAITQPRAAA